MIVAENKRGLLGEEMEPNLERVTCFRTKRKFYSEKKSVLGQTEKRHLGQREKRHLETSIRNIF